MVLTGGGGKATDMMRVKGGGFCARNKVRQVVCILEMNLFGGVLPLATKIHAPLKPASVLR